MTRAHEYNTHPLPCCMRRGGLQAADHLHTGCVQVLLKIAEGPLAVKLASKFYVYQMGVAMKEKAMELPMTLDELEHGRSTDRTSIALLAIVSLNLSHAYGLCTPQRLARSTRSRTSRPN